MTSPKICRVSQQTGERLRRANGIVPVQRLLVLRSKSQYFSLNLKEGKTWYSISKAVRQEESCFSWLKVSIFVLFILSTDWMRPTYLREGNLLYLVNLNVNPIQKHLHRYNQRNVWPNIWECHGAIKLIHKLTNTH